MDIRVGDQVKLLTTAVRSNRCSIPLQLKGPNNKWLVTAQNPETGTIILGKRYVLGKLISASPPVEVFPESVEIIEGVCRHIHTAYIPGSNPTCTSPRIRPGLRCTECGQVLEEPKIDPDVGAFGHMFEYDYANSRKVCQRCKYEEYVEDKVVNFRVADLKAMIQQLSNMIEDDEEDYPDFSNYCSLDDTTWDTVTECDYKVAKIEDPDTFNYILHSPSKITPSSEDITWNISSVTDVEYDGKKLTLPLIIWLHEDEFISTEDFIRTEEGVYKTKHCEEQEACSAPYSHLAYFVFPHLEAGSWVNSKERFFAFLDKICKLYPVDTQRILIGGKDSGADGALFYFYQDPERFSKLCLLDPSSDSKIDLTSLVDRKNDILLCTDKELAEEELADQPESEETPDKEPSKIATYMNTLSTTFNVKVQTVEADDIFEQAGETETETGKVETGVKHLLENPYQKNNEQLVPANVTHAKIPVWSAPQTYSPVVEGRYVLLGHQLKFAADTDPVEHQNYVWGKIDPETWYYTGNLAPRIITDVDCWIPLEYTSARSAISVPKDHYVQPCDFTDIARHFGTFMHRGLVYEHYGVDLSAPFGTPVYLAGKFGDVNNTFTIDSITHGDDDELSVTFVNEAKSLKFIYSRIHLPEGVSVGQSYCPGDFIGNIAEPTGSWNTRPHLYFQVYEGGKYVDPEITYITSKST